MKTQKFDLQGSAIFLNTNRTMMTENEKAWIKENSKKIMEKVKGKLPKNENGLFT